MMVIQAPTPSKVVRNVGVFLILMGVLEAKYTYDLLAEVFPLTRSDLLPVTLSFVPALIICALGIGVLLYKRWALFAWLGLTGLALVGLLADLAVSLLSRFPPFEVIFAVIPAFVGLLFMGIPAYILWTRRSLFMSGARAAGP